MLKPGGLTDSGEERDCIRECRGEELYKERRIFWSTRVSREPCWKGLKASSTELRVGFMPMDEDCSAPSSSCRQRPSKHEV
jgi:hypothetical protein